MSITTGADLITVGNLGSHLDEGILSPHIDTAEHKVRVLITDAVYDEVKGYEGSEAEAEQKKFNLLKLAETNLALSYAVHSLNIETQGNGIVRSKGYDQSRSDLLSRNEVNDLSDHYRDVATELLNPFIPAPVIPEDQDYTDSVDTGGFSLSVL